MVFLAGTVLLPGISFAQFNDTTRHVDTTRVSYHKDSLWSRPKINSAADIAWQFLAGEAAFNITSFSLWGDELYKGPSQVSLNGIGIVASMITVPLAIHFTSELIGMKTGDWGWSTLGAFASFLLISSPIIANNQHRTYLFSYLVTSLPIIIISQLVYDLTIK